MDNTTKIEFLPIYALVVSIMQIFVGALIGATLAHHEYTLCEFFILLASAFAALGKVCTQKLVKVQKEGPDSYSDTISTEEFTNSLAWGGGMFFTYNLIALILVYFA